MNEKLNIEELFKSKLEEMEYSPSPSVWTKTSRILRRKQFLRFNPGKFNIYYTIGAILIGTVLTFSLLDKKAQGTRHEAQGGSEISVVENYEQEELNIDSPSAGSSTSSPGHSGDEDNLNENASTSLSQPGTSPSASSGDGDILNNNASASLGEKAFSSTSPTADLRDEDDLRINDSQPETRNPQPVSTLIPYFTPSVYEGCAPLTLELVNSSVNASSFKWVINGEERKSEAGSRKPEVFTFEEAGVYTVTLVASNELGIQVTHTEQVIVHPKPRAEFEIEGENIYNYSSGASDFEWELLRKDEQSSRKEAQRFSTDFQPNLNDINPQPATRNPQLFLTVTNNFGCTDTSSLFLPIANGPSLLFPTAFSPNPGGSTGGYYNINGANNNIFYPKHKEKPANYKLQIFNKAGELIYTSTNIDLGWDGYYKEARAAQGVYVYQCTGTWKDGESYNYRGDITILWTEN